MDVPTLDTEIDLINAALTATGNSPITSLEDGTSEAEIAAANWDAVVGPEFEHPWTWTHTTRRLNRVDGTGTDTAFLYAYQVPIGFEVERVEVCARLVPWESMGDLILCNQDDNVVAICRWRPPVRNWPPSFKGAIIKRLEALFLRAISDDHEEAAARDQAAEKAFLRAKNKDSGKRSPRRPGTSALLEARGARRWIS